MIVLMAWYMVLYIANDIVTPIKSLKNMIQGINISDNNEHKNIIKEDKEGENSETLRCAEMDKLYDILLKLKHVLSFTSNSKIIYDKSSLINYVNAKYTFNEVSNFNGKTVCDSNVGNLTMKFKKYDKAIFHLMETLEDFKKHEKIPRLDFISEEWRKSFKNKKSFLTRKRSLLDEDEERLQAVHDDITLTAYHSAHNHNSYHSKHVFLKSRFPKLIYSFKKFFKLLEVVSIKKDFIEDFAKNDLFIFKDRQSLESYENTLMNYISMAMQVSENRKVAESVLDYIQFLINFRLKSDGQNLRQNVPEKIEKINSKDKIIEQICILLKDFDLAYEQLEKSDNNQEYYKIFLDNLKSRGHRNENIELPHNILLQRYYYLKGKLAKICGHLQKAIEYFTKSMEMGIVCDARIIEKSIKQIIKLMTFSSLKIDEEIKKENVKINALKEKPLKEGFNYAKSNSNQYSLVNKLKDINKDIEAYLDTMKKNLDLFNSPPKDVVVLIDTSMNGNTDNRKIQNAEKLIKTIYNDYISLADGFALFNYDENVNTVIALHRKDYNNFNYMKSMLDNIIIDNFKYAKDLKITETSNIFKAIEYCNKYLQKKSRMKNREKWVIVLTDYIYKTNDDIDIVKGLHDDGLNVIVVGCYLSNQDMSYMYRCLGHISNRSELIDFEDLGKFKLIFKCHGEVKKEYHYPNEKYESDKK
jgi:hypothetical protein